MGLVFVVAVSAWAKAAAAVMIREAPDAETRFWRAALAGAMFALWAYAVVDMIPSPLNRLGAFFPSDEMLRWTCGAVGAAAGAALWFAGGFFRFGKSSPWHLLPAVLMLAPFVYRFATAPRANWPLERLAEAVAEGKPRTAQRAVAVLAGKGPAAVPILISALGEPGLRIQAVDALARVGEPAVRSLRPLLGGAPELKAAAAEILGKIGPPAREAVPELSALVDGSQQAPRLAAIDALGRMGPTAFLGIPALERAAQTEPRAQDALRKVATAEAVRALRDYRAPPARR